MPSLPPEMIRDAVVLEGGLDFRSAKSLLKPGTLSDMLNYEIIDRTGYKRIDGYLKFDGSTDFQDENIFYVKSASASTVLPSTFVPYYLYAETGAGASKYAKDYPFGLAFAWHAVSSTEGYLFYWRINKKYEATFGDNVRAAGVATGTFYFKSITQSPDVWTNASTFSPSSWKCAGIPSFYTSDNVKSSRRLCSYIDQFYNKAYSHQGTIPSGSQAGNFPEMFASYEQAWSGIRSPLPIVGLHWFKDYLLAVTDPHYLELHTLTAQPFPGDTFSFNAYTGRDTSATGHPLHGQVLYAELIGSSSWTGGTTNDTARIWYKDTDVNEDDNATHAVAARRKKFRAGMGYHLPSEFAPTPATLVLDRSAATIGKVNTTTTSYKADAPIATLYRTFNEAQAYDEGAVVSFTVTGAGTGYTRPPMVTITSTTGSGATAYATINVGTGAVTGIYVLSGGKGYTSSDTVTISGGGGANATATLSVSTWRDAGARLIDTGWQVDFTSGSSKSGYLTKVNRNNNLASQISTITASGLTATGHAGRILVGLNFEGANGTGVSGTTWAPYTGNTLDQSYVRTLSDGKYIYSLLIDQLIGDSTGKTQSAGFINFDTIGTTPSNNSVVRGISVVVKSATGGGFLSAPTNYQLRATLFRTDDPNSSARKDTRIGNSKTIALSNHAGATTATSTFGADGDLWGTTGLTFNDIKDPNFGVAIDLILAAPGNTYNFAWQIDEIYLVFYYNEPSIRYYFTNGSGQIVRGDLVDYSISKGSLVAGDAQGIMQLTNVQPYATAATPVHTIKSGWNIYQDSGLTALVGVTSSNMAYNAPEPRASIVAAGTLYQWVTANFYGNEQWRSAYGCSGAGRAFIYDGTYFQKIFAINPGETDSSSKDKPRFVTTLKGRLALGYPHGAVLLSVPGTPQDFSGLRGAAERDTGERITGFAALQGEYLAVGGTNSIFGLVGDDLQVTTLVPGNGIIPYTMVNVGDRPIFCTSTGIATLAQSQKYGDFEGNRLSWKVTPWILRRLNVDDNLFSASSASGVVAAYPSRHDNQYRLLFKDGYILSMTLVGEEQDPQFSFRRYITSTASPVDVTITASSYRLNNSTLTSNFYPLAICSQVDTSGTERMFFAIDIHAVPYSNGSVSNAYTMQDSYVYQIDKGWGFDIGPFIVPIPAYFITNHYYMENPYCTHNIRKIRLEGSSRNIGDMVISTEKNYTAPTLTSTTKIVKASVPGSATYPNLIPDDYVAQSTMCNVAENDRVVQIRVDTGNANGIRTGTLKNLSPYGYTPDFIQPPHFAQLMLVQFSEGHDDA